MQKKYLAEFLIPKAHITVEEILDDIKLNWCLVCYLIINWRIDELRQKAQLEIPTSAYMVLAENLYNYVYNDEMPPKEIATTIMNVADDFVRGEQVKLGAGDYIALQDYARNL